MNLQILTPNYDMFCYTIAPKYLDKSRHTYVHIFCQRIKHTENNRKLFIHRNEDHKV